MNGKLLPETWLAKLAIDCFDQISTTNSKVKSKDCSPEGLYPVIDQGQNYISGYINDESKVIKVDSPICIFGDHTRIVKWVTHDFVPGADGTKLLQPKAFIHPRYAYYSLRTLNIPDKGYSRHFKYFKELEINLPGRLEQKIIAEKLDTLLAQVESTKARLEQIPQILKRFRQAVLAAAVRGELTEGWHTDPNLVSAKSILNEIETERNQAKNNNLIKQSFGKHKDTSPLFHVPSNSWEWVCLEQICATNNNALKAGPFGSALKKADCVEVGYKVYGQEQVISGSESLETYRINDDKYEQLKSCATGPGDILISLVGTIGKVLVLSAQAEFGIINPRLVKITLHNTISPQYIKTYLDSPVSHSFFKGFSHGGTMEILNLGILKELPIALPPLEEQHEIVRRVEQLFAYADTIEKQVNSALTRVNSLTQSILAKAFRGELTAQWRAENPDLISGENSAAALLEKIKAERAASGGKKASRKKA